MQYLAPIPVPIVQVPANGKNLVEVLCDKGPNFTVTNWPDAPYCVKTCSNFIDVPKMKPVDTNPVLAGHKVEYKCKNPAKIPETGAKVLIECMADGTFAVSCREKFRFLRQL